MTFQNIFKKYLTSEVFFYTFIASISMILCTSVFENLIKFNGYDDATRISYKLFAFVLVLILGAILKSYVFFAIGQRENILKESGYCDFIKKIFSEWMIVEVRVQFRVLIGLLLLIVPGVIESLRLSLASIMVFYNPKMDDPSYDPVMDSRAILNFNNARPLVIIFLFSIMSLGVGLALSSANFFDGGLGFFKALLSSFLNALLILATYSYLVHLYLTVTSLSTTSNKEN